ncbi:SMI1/KNR4 family protein [Streptomyces jeddahensis]|uniref:Knr4/Smi1-like domain-containing protein n=1 Tax=Streptomyces jeddahensis TaxID=1716141 RepID=A0A177HRI9_9ACTN|nr:SMI1/KNR4 family protein [Streptomyces jeddahensis]OAH13199.1 hypothetical protein STSP_35240 [Streptomyces jeddahensis]
MTAELQRVVDELRAAMSGQSEWRMMNSLPAGARRDELGSALPASYREFLEVVNGATCGDVTVFGVPTVDGMQFHADPVPGAAVVLGRDEWFCCGVIADEPFFVNRATGEVWYFPDTGVQWWMSSSFERAADDFTSFFLRWVAGPEYVRLSATGRDDQWADLLSHVGRLEQGPAE